MVSILTDTFIKKDILAYLGDTMKPKTKKDYYANLGIDHRQVSEDTYVCVRNLTARGETKWYHGILK